MTGRVERVSATDRVYHELSRVGLAERLAAVLMFDDDVSFDLDDLRRILGGRIRAVPRLRQRVVKVPVGCGGPVWLDDPHFDLATHVTQVWLPPGSDEDDLLQACLRVVASGPPRTGPAWSAVLVHRHGAGPALVITLDHCLADGIGGLAVLAAFVDPGLPPGDPGFPRPLPARAELFADTWRRRASALSRFPRALRELRSALTAAGGIRPAPVSHCTLVHPTGPRRSLATLTFPAADLTQAAHRHGVTTNDLILTAVGGALGTFLEARGEAVAAPLTLVVPASGRASRPAGASMGNLVTPILVEVPTRGPQLARLLRVAQQTSRKKASAQGRPLTALLGWPFRLFIRLGGYGRYLHHQRRFHSLVTHVRGPGEVLHLAGHPIRRAVPLSVAGGSNLAVHFAVLSYAGTVTVTVLVDADRVPEVAQLREALCAEVELFLRESDP